MKNMGNYNRRVNEMFDNSIVLNIGWKDRIYTFGRSDRYS